jgi:hypothetical protein
MAKKAKKTRKASSGATGTGATHRAVTGRAPRGREWDPTLPEAQAPAHLPEVNVPRLYTSRYPISNEAFEALKSAAPKAKLPKVTAERARDKGKKTELSALAPAAAALAPGTTLPALRRPAGCHPTAPWRSVHSTCWLR